MSETPEAMPEALQEADAAWRAGDGDGAFRRVVAYIEAEPALVAPARPGQAMTIAILNPFPSLPFRSLEDLHHSGNFPSQLAARLGEKFRFVSIFAEAGKAAEAARLVPRPDVVLNNIANAEELSRSPETNARINRVIAALGAPVVNAPDKAIRATRQRNAALLAAIPGVAAPVIGRVWNDRDRRRELVAHLAGKFGYPLIVRSVFEQMGQLTFLAENAEALERALSELDQEPQIYAIAYRPSPHQDGLFRVLRAACVDGKARLIRADFGFGWNVRARREPSTQAVYRERPDLLERANAIVQAPQAHLRAPAFAALERVAKTVPLDIFGLDFDVTPNGDLVVFEANATMNFFSNVPAGLEYPAEPEQALEADIVAALAARAGAA